MRHGLGPKPLREYFAHRGVDQTPPHGPTIADPATDAVHVIRVITLGVMCYSIISVMEEAS